MRGHTKRLAIIADDLGIGPETTRGILAVAARGRLTGAVLIVNSPYAEEAVKLSRPLQNTFELGWHPCLTQDRPILPAVDVPSLVDADGFFHPLGRFISHSFRRKLNPLEVRRELQAQLGRFRELTGFAPRLVNSHQHVALFKPVAEALRKTLRVLAELPYIRRVVEPLGCNCFIGGNRFKRLALTIMARIGSGEWNGFPGNRRLLGVSGPAMASRPDYFARWLKRVPVGLNELMVHPGYWDDTLAGRDCRDGDGLQQRRLDELRGLLAPDFESLLEWNGIQLIGANGFRELLERRVRLHAA